MEHTSDSVKELFARTTVTPAKSSFESSDREQSWLRIVFAFVAVLWSESHPLDREEKIFGLDAHEFVALSFLFLSIVYFLLWKVTYSKFREKAPLFRWLCVASDISAISLYTAISDRAATILLPIYLSAIIGYGMRFGRSYLIVALILSLLEFCIAEHFNQFLLNNSEILTCYILSMLFLPIYTVILLEKYSVVLNAYKLAFNQKEEFITILSHEFRAPLHSIVSVSESIRLGLRYLGLSKDAERFLSSNIRLILSCTERMLSVANRITSQQNYSRKSQEASTIWFNTYHDIYLAIRVCSVQALRKRLRLSWRLDSNVPCTTTCESSTVQEILINLLDNSLKHTHQGCVALTVRFFPLTDSTGTLEILVSDTGAGMAHSVDEDISPNDSARELSPIVRKSSRLGLAITKMAVARLGGWISSTASFNKGTEILVSIPVDTRIPPATSGEVWLRILVVGDRVLTAEEESLLAGERLYPCYFSIDLDNSEGVAPDTGAFIALLEDEPESATRFFDQFSESYVVHVPVVMLASSLRNGQVSGEPFANFVIDMDYPLEASARLRSLRTFAIRDRKSTRLNSSHG